MCVPVQPFSATAGLLVNVRVDGDYFDSPSVNLAIVPERSESDIAVFMFMICKIKL